MRKKNTQILSLLEVSLINLTKKLRVRTVRQELKSSRIVNKFTMNINKQLTREFLTLKELVMLTSYPLYPKMAGFMNSMDSKSVLLIMELAQKRNSWARQQLRSRSSWRETQTTSTSL